MTPLMTPMTDLSFTEYTDRQFRELEPDRLMERAMALRRSGNYKYAGAWVPQMYPGFAVVSMVDENPGNGNLSERLQVIQQQLIEQCRWEESLYLLPAGSFHQTVANMLSEERFLQRIVRPGLEPAYPSLVARAFARIPAGSFFGRPVTRRKPCAGSP